MYSNTTENLRHLSIQREGNFFLILKLPFLHVHLKITNREMGIVHIPQRIRCRRPISAISRITESTLHGLIGEDT